MNKTCPDCGQNLTEQRWERGADSKKFHAYRHEVKSDCKFIEWINDEPKYQPKPTQETASQIVAMRKLYALILAVAHLSGIKQEDINAELERISYIGE